MIALIRGDLLEQACCREIAVFARLLRKVLVHFGVLVVLAGHGIEQIRFVCFCQFEGIGFTGKMLVRFDVSRLFEHRGELWLAALAGHIRIGSVFEIGVGFAVHRRLKILLCPRI